MDKQIQNFASLRGFFRWKPAAWLRVTGDDAFTFLQGQFTNDLRGLSSTAAVYGLWLNHKGKVLADSFVGTNGAGEFWVGSSFSSVEVIRQRLEAYIIADDVVIEDLTSSMVGITVVDEQQPPANSLREVITFAGRRGASAAREYVLPSSMNDEFTKQFDGLPQIEARDMERARIAAGVPAVPTDIGPGELPNEGGLDDSALSYTKGCYLGQEVMARLKSMGQVRRRLMRVRIEGALPTLPAAVFQAGRKVGELRSAVIDEGGSRGLALLSLLNLQRNEGLSFSETGTAALTLAENS